MIKINIEPLISYTLRVEGIIIKPISIDISYILRVEWIIKPTYSKREEYIELRWYNLAWSLKIKNKEDCGHEIKSKTNIEWEENETKHHKKLWYLIWWWGWLITSFHMVLTCPSSSSLYL